MNRNVALMLFAFLSLVLSSCVILSRQYDISEYNSYKFRSELGQVYTRAQLLISEERYNRLNQYFQSIFPFRYENYCIWINIIDWSYLSKDFNNDEDTMLYMYIDECRITLPSGRIIIVPMDNNKVNYSYTGRDYKRKAPPKTLQDVQPQYTEDGRKVLYLDSIVDDDGVWINFFAKIPSSAQTLRLEYSFTVVWENLGEVKMRYSLLFKKISFMTNIPTV